MNVSRVNLILSKSLTIKVNSPGAAGDPPIIESNSPSSSVPAPSLVFQTKNGIQGKYKNK